MKTSLYQGRMLASLPQASWFVTAVALLAIINLPIHADLVAHWTFDEPDGTVAHDSVGGLNGALSPTGSAFVAGGISSNAISLDRATNGFVNMGNVLPLTNQSFSIGAWIKMNPGDTTPETVILSKHEGGFVNGYLLGVNQLGGGGQDGKALFYAGGLAVDGPVSQTSVNDGNWHHVVGVYRSGVNKIIYVDGIAENTNSVPPIIDNTASFMVGGINQSGFPVSHFTGLVDDVQVYNRALRPNDVSYLFQNPGRISPTPSNCAPAPLGLVSWWQGDVTTTDSADGNSGALAGNTTFGDGRVGQGFVFDGNADGVIIGNPANLQLQNFTIEAWVKRSSTTRVSQENLDSGIIFCYTDGGYALGLHDDGRPYLSKVGVSHVSSTLAITDTNGFHHVAVTKTGSSVVFYVDAVGQAVGPYNPGFEFLGPAAIGARGGDLVASFYGAIDELAIYNRALGSNEIAGIFIADSAGKCGAAPSITAQPTDQTVIAGGTVTFSVAANGTAPLNYQWRRGGTNLTGATATSLVLSNVQLGDAGVYSVRVTNGFGSVVSSNAVLTVNPVSTSCNTAPSGIVGWWSGEGSALDSAAANHGSMVGNASFGAGRVGQSFVFDGSGDGVHLGSPASLQLQDFTIEAWIKRASSFITSFDHPIFSSLLCWGAGGYALGLQSDGRLYLSKVEVGDVGVPNAVTDTAWHHVAVTKSGSSLIFYVDGVAHAGPAYDPGFTFSTPLAIGVKLVGTPPASFYGAIDELAVYNRALAAAELQAIFNAGGFGKCTSPSPPHIVSHPSDQTAVVGGTATFSVTAAGTMPLTYQWRFNFTNLSGATSSSLVLSNVQSADAGNYSVVVSNVGGTATSSNAVLTVNPPPPCATPPSGLVSWWRGEANAEEQTRANSGTIVGNTTFGAGRVGQTFVFDGSGDAVSIGNPINLQLQNFTLEAWVKRASPSVVTFDSPNGSAEFLSYGPGGYAFGFLNDGRLFLGNVGVSQTQTSVAIADTNFHHVAVTKSGTTVVFYIDGATYAAPEYSTTFTFTTPAAIGALGGNLVASLYGSIDEMSIYNRALPASEIQTIYNAGSAGKCVSVTPPFIASQPTNHAIVVGSTAMFSVSAGGTQPLSYQWQYNGINLAGATASSLVFTNAQFANAGTYSVIVTNVAGTVTSSNATLTVAFPPAAIQVVNSTGAAGGAATVPIVLVANGNENASGFSLNFDPAMLTYANSSLGSNAAGATLFVNTNQVGSGKLGIALALPAEGTFAAGTQQVVQVGFTAAIVTSATSTTISFGDIPIGRQLSDAPGNALAATYSSGNVLIPAVAFEADVSPRPNGNQDVTITDWVLAGRYAARLDYPTNASEFQRADCAPRESLGNGVISVTDWVQAGRYASRLDPLTPTGGPASETPAPVDTTQVRAQGGDPRQLQIVDELLVQNQAGNVCVRLTALGDENALGFSLSFDPAALSFAGATLGSGAGGATLNLNTNQAASGKLGLVLGLPTGATFGTGSKELVQVRLRASGSASGSYPVTFANQPVPGEISDAAAHVLSAGYVNGTAAVNLPPLLAISRANQDITVSWPLWATNFALQVAEGAFPPVTWTNVVGTVGVSNAARVITVPISGGMKFYRLSSP